VTTMHDEKLVNLAEQVGTSLLQSSLKIVTAESCTGGGIAWFLTAIPGSSAWVDRGFIVYSNQAKQDLLQVQALTMQEYGAVSEQVALEMADGALHSSVADISVAVTGIAGPDGGTDAKPVGTVCLAWQQRHGRAISTRVQFQGVRAEVRALAISMAMQGVLELIGSN